MTKTKLCLLLAALVMLARARVTLLPGWVVPLPALLLAAELAACATVITWIVAAARRERRAYRPRQITAGSRS